MTHISYRGGVSIAELVFYVPALAIAVFLTIRHGFSRASGWRFMIIFTLARILSSSFAIALDSKPTNESLYIGYSILINIALSPLLLVSFGLMSRLLSDINARNVSTIIQPRMIQIIQIVTTVGLILGIVGGDEAGSDFSKTGVYKVKTLTKVSVVIFAICLTALFFIAVLMVPVISHAPPGEKRLLWATMIAIPFLLVRLIYSLISVFAGLKSFSFLSGNETVLLCMALLEEVVVVIIYEFVGLTLGKVEKQQQYQDSEMQNRQRAYIANLQHGHMGCAKTSNSLHTLSPI